MVGGLPSTSLMDAAICKLFLNFLFDSSISLWNLICCRASVADRLCALTSSQQGIASSFQASYQTHLQSKGRLFGHGPAAEAPFDVAVK